MKSICKAPFRFNTMRNYLFLLFLFFSPALLWSQAEDPFDELVREKKEIFGSEKEEKYPLRAGFVDWERWEGHSSVHVLWFIRYTDYPKFKQFRIFPFYNSLEAKSGNASKSYLFPFYSYRSLSSEGIDDRTFLSPVYYRRTVQPSGGGTGYRESTHFYWLGYNSDSSGPGFEKSFSMYPGFFPLITKENELIGGVRSASTIILPLLFFNKESSEESKTTLTLFHWGHDLEKRFFVFFPLLHYSAEKIREDYSFTFFPFYHQSRSSRESKKFTIYSPIWFQDEEKTSDSYSEYSFSPIGWYKSKSVSLRSETTKFLFLPLALYLQENGEDYKIRNFLLFQWGREKNWSYFRVLPLLYWSSSKDQSDSRFTFFPFVFYKENSYFHLFPVFFSWKDSKEESGYAGPLYYHSESPNHNTNYFLNTFVKWEKDKGLSEVVSAPIFFYKKESYLTVFPLYHHNYDAGEFTQFIFPLIYRKDAKDYSENLIFNTYWKKDKEGLTALTIFPFWFQKKNEFAHLFPVFFSWENSKDDASFAGPLYYRNKNPNSSSTYIINTYSEYQQDELAAFVFFPFWYFKKNEYKHLVPFYFSWTDGERSDNRAGPFFYRHRSAEVAHDYYLNTYFKREREKGLTQLISVPILFYKKDSYLTILPVYHHSYDGDDFTRFTLLPLPTYRHSRKQESETLVLNAYWSRDAKGEYLSSFFFPFYFHKKNSYFSIPLLLFFHTGTETEKRTIAPFYYKHYSETEDELFVLGYHEYGSNDSSFRRFYPIYFSSKEKTGESFLGLAGLYYQWKDPAGETTTRTILPLHYFQKNEYNLWLPFYYRFGGDDKDYVSFSPIHYRLRSSRVDRDWALFYYSSDNREEKTSSTFVAPLYWQWKNADSRGDIFLPAYLKYYEKNKNLELYFGGISVSQTGGKFDASLKSGSSGKEFYVDLDYAFVYNLFSVSLRKELSNPLTFFEDEKKEESAPVLPQAKNPKKDDAKKDVRIAVVGEEKGQNPPQEGSNFVSYKKLARENSRNYFGWEALFGIASYQSGDDKKHFRILPLGWFTWGKNNDDKIFAFPLPLPTFWGTIGDESYRVVFPLYAEQKKGNDYVRSLGIFLFVMEQEKDRKEYSVLWPLIRYSKSKEEVAYRFFPFFAHRESASSIETKSIFYYRTKEKTGTFEHSSFHGILFPLYQASEDYAHSGNNSNGSGYSVFFPFYFRNYEDRINDGNVVLKDRNLYTPLFLYSFREDVSLKTKSSFLLSPFYYGRSEEANALDKSYVSELNVILPIPFLLWGRENSEKYRFVFGHYSASSPDASSWNFLLLTGASQWKQNEKEEVSSFYVFPFYFGKTIKEGENWKFKSDTVPFFYSAKRTPDSYDATFALIFSYRKNSVTQDERLFLPPFFYYEKERNPFGQIDSTVFSLLYFHKSLKQGTSKLDSYSNNNFYTILPIPLFYTYESITENETRTETNGWTWLFLADLEQKKLPILKKESFEFRVLLGLLAGYSSETEPNQKSRSWNVSLFFFRKTKQENGVQIYSSSLIPILYSNEETPTSSEINFLLLAGKKTDQKTGLKRTMFLPFWYQKEEVVRKGYVDDFTFTPLFFQTKSVQDGAEANLYASRFYSILPIPLLYTFEERIRQDKVRKDVWGFDWLFLANYKNTQYLHNGSESTSFKAVLGLFGYEKNGMEGEHETSSYLFPFFFYKSSDHKDYDYYRWIVPIVSYRSFNESQGKIRSHTNLFGILLNYKRDDEAGTKSLYLFPSLYYSSDRSGAEKTFLLFPFVYTSFNEGKEYSLFLMGYYQGRSSTSNRYNFLYLVDLESSLLEQKRELSLFLGVFQSQFEKDRTRWSVLGGVLAGYESTPQMTDWNFLWIHYLNSPQERIHNFLPVYRYSETAESYSLLLPPILSYHSKDKDGSLTLGGLFGLIYYNNRSEVYKEESTKVLGGLFYFSETKAERGFRNRGIFGFPAIGGLIWNHEYEAQTGYEKTSFFKFIYSRTTTVKGTSFSRIFGIKVFESAKGSDSE
ncbi:hypothetical protein CH380_01810 [Leptospira adleri]|uniref:Uncharacterized protein n=2 Tax=Leptospira adleri TaxID=2023186 RepID=A0A2M9YUR8_9LEPT|nr:hypothetical protein [Leptospira adleri]PJZ55265.1 hypothetical protein CH380_01810 [Leptospira adleri]PJZ62427.1 hypothetical protein CH376_07975 [Leptospira adleri]